MTSCFLSWAKTTFSNGDISYREEFAPSVTNFSTSIENEAKIETVELLPLIIYLFTLKKAKERYLFIKPFRKLHYHHFSIFVCMYSSKICFYL